MQEREDNKETAVQHVLLCRTAVSLYKSLLENKLNNLDKYKCSSYFLTVHKFMNITIANYA